MLKLKIGSNYICLCETVLKNKKITRNIKLFRYVRLTLFILTPDVDKDSVLNILFPESEMRIYHSIVKERNIYAYTMRSKERHRLTFTDLFAHDGAV